MIAPNPHKPHEPTVACESEHCYIHHVDEPDGFMACFECKHSYVTPRDLWVALIRAKLAAELIDSEEAQRMFLIHNSEMNRLVGQITYCPVCGHDF